MQSFALGHSGRQLATFFFHLMGLECRVNSCSAWRDLRREFISSWIMLVISLIRSSLWNWRHAQCGVPEHPSVPQGHSESVLPLPELSLKSIKSVRHCWWHWRMDSCMFCLRKIKGPCHSVMLSKSSCWFTLPGGTLQAVLHVCGWEGFCYRSGGLRSIFSSPNGLSCRLGVNGIASCHF